MNPFDPSSADDTIASNDSSLGLIKISHSVVASIVRLAALEVQGVCAVGGGLVDGIAEIFSKKESDRGVRISECDDGQYNIELRVIIQFGIELAKVASQIQQNVCDQVVRMTMKGVKKVDVIIDGIRVVKEDPQAKQKIWLEETESQ